MRNRGVFFSARLRVDFQVLRKIEFCSSAEAAVGVLAEGLGGGVCQNRFVEASFCGLCSFFLIDCVPTHVFIFFKQKTKPTRLVFILFWAASSTSSFFLCSVFSRCLFDKYFVQGKS